MTKNNSTARDGERTPRKPAKPKKPHKDFPLYAHATKRWAKKVKGKLYYFGPWDKPQEALAKWLAEKDDILAGRVPQSKTGVMTPTLRELCSRFLTTKTQLQESGELAGAGRPFIQGLPRHMQCLAQGVRQGPAVDRHSA